MYKNRFSLGFTAIFAAAVFLLAGCNLSTNPGPTIDTTPPDVTGTVTPVNFDTAATKTLNLDSSLPAGKQVYLVTVNTTGTIQGVGPSVAASAPSLGPSEFLGGDPRSAALAASSRSLLDSGDVPAGHHPGAAAFNANPPPITPDMPQSRVSAFSASVVPYTVDVSTKSFWVESAIDSGSWVQKSATLRAQGTYSNVWVIENWGTNAAAQAPALAAKFDQIYPVETKVLGYEYGGGAGGNGGKDGDSRIQILVYDFNGSSADSYNTAGFYWSKDFYTQAQLEAWVYSEKTNNAEIFYISATHLANPADTNTNYSMLVHEFQHMINFNVKNVQHPELNPQAWYNEMLSMMAEDMISPLIGISPTNSGHPIRQRISGFLTSYHNEGVTTWNSNLESYSYKYAIGAYLARNYGGAELVKNILANNSANETSIVAALRQTTGNTSIDFNYAVEKFAEAFIFNQSGTDRATFNKNDTRTISGTEYTFTGFDIWNHYNWTGPNVYTLASTHNMQPHSVFLRTSTSWQTGTLTSVTLNKPAVDGVKLFLMIR